MPRLIQHFLEFLSALQQKSALTKAAIIIAGYLLSIALALGLVALRVALSSDPEQHSSGMAAFGDMLLFLAAFGLFAALPTGLALYFLRPTLNTWMAVASLAPWLAATGPAAALLVALVLWRPDTTLFTGGPLLLAILRTVVAPFLACAFALAALVAPNMVKRRLQFALLLETAGCVFGVVRWFIPT